MFSIKQTPFGNTHLLHLKNEQTGCFATILPEYGCRLQQVAFALKGTHFSLLKSAQTFPQFLAEDITNYSGAFLFPFVDRLQDATYHFEGRKYQLPANDATSRHALHGFLADASFAVVNTCCDEKTALVQTSFCYDGEENGYPFPCRIEIQYRLSAQQLSCTTRVTNTGPQNMPVAFGWHPYFQLSAPLDNYELHVPAKAQFYINDNYLNTGKRIVMAKKGTTSVRLRPGLFGCFELAAEQPSVVWLWNKKEGHIITLTTTGEQERFDYCQVYVTANGDAVALEPMTAIGNALNNGIGLQVLHPGESLTKHFDLRLEMQAAL